MTTKLEDMAHELASLIGPDVSDEDLAVSVELLGRHGSDEPAAFHQLVERIRTLEPARVAHALERELGTLTLPSAPADRAPVSKNDEVDRHRRQVADSVRGVLRLWNADPAGPGAVTYQHEAERLRSELHRIEDWLGTTRSVAPTAARSVHSAPRTRGLMLAVGLAALLAVVVIALSSRKSTDELEPLPPTSRIDPPRTPPPPAQPQPQPPPPQQLEPTQQQDLRTVTIRGSRWTHDDIVKLVARAGDAPAVLAFFELCAAHGGSVFLETEIHARSGNAKLAQTTAQLRQITRAAEEVQGSKQWPVEVTTRGRVLAYRVKPPIAEWIADARRRAHDLQP